jgi:hypothetical protein
MSERSHSGNLEDMAETARRIKASAAAVRRGDYTDYDEHGLRMLGKKIIAGVSGEKSGRKKRG